MQTFTNSAKLKKLQRLPYNKYQDSVIHLSASRNINGQCAICHITRSVNLQPQAIKPQSEALLPCCELILNPLFSEGIGECEGKKGRQQIPLKMEKSRFELMPRGVCFSAVARAS
jgi:hypothetical protein